MNNISEHLKIVKDVFPDENQHLDELYGGNELLPIVFESMTNHLLGVKYDIRDLLIPNLTFNNLTNREFWGSTSPSRPSRDFYGIPNSSLRRELIQRGVIWE